MAHTYEQVNGTPERAMAKMEHDRKRKPLIALAVIMAGLLAIIGVTYFSYKGVAAPDNPANARPQMVDPPARY